MWATERLLDACTALTPEQLNTPAPGTYGSILATLRHLVEADSWYLSFFRDRTAQVIHHGTDHRSQICTALTSLGLTPPAIDVWAFAQATGRERVVVSAFGATTG